MAVSLPSYRLASDSDDNEALRKALATGQPVYLPEGQGRGPRGEYLIDTSPGTDANVGAGNLVSGAFLYGDGVGRTIVRQTRDYVFLANSRSADPAQNVRDVTIKSMTIAGYNEGVLDDFSYLVLLAGVTNVLIEQVEFRGFSGDGLFLGSPQVELERHNIGVTVRASTFNGVNRQNRNAISIIDCLDWLIDGCSFVNCTNDYHPGPIDVEPERPFNRVERGKVTGCYFADNGGYALNLSFGIDQRSYAAVSDIRFEYCSVRRSTGAFAWIGFFKDANRPEVDSIAAPAPYKIDVNHLYVVETKMPFLLRGAYGLTLTANEVYDSDVSTILPHGTSRQVSVTGNAFVRCGRTNGPVWIEDGSVLDFSISNNHFIDCGRPDGGFGPIYFLRGSGDAPRVEGLKIDDNRVEVQTSPARTTQVALIGGGSNATIVRSEKLRNTTIGFTPADNFNATYP